ncbi:MAG TPA: 3-hydroxyacyl-CoA dehydrogenase [Rhodobacteraceae bacterium]|nr:3-hydroxyacyl-CoA dehydrogenase [Paracoccaceae bacterium]
MLQIGFGIVLFTQYLKVVPSNSGERAVEAEMSETVRYETREGVALITVANPPVNALVQPVRAGLDAALSRAIEDPDIGAIVIRAQGRTFPAGTDVRDFHREADRPRLGEVCARIEVAPKPVIAAIHGTALGGGLELALACHYRLALAGTQFGLPDVMLGVVPTAGGTQRLPRLVGPARALEMLLSGRPVMAKQAERAGLIDKMIRKNLDRAAFGTARNMAREGQPPRPTRAWTAGLRDPGAYLAVVAGRRSALLDAPEAAPAKVVHLVEAALLLPFDSGLAMERAVYESLVDSPEARGLRHAFLAERRCARDQGRADAPPRKVELVAVLGQGADAARVARACLAGGLPVLLAEPDGPVRLALRARIVADYSEDVRTGRVASEDRDAELKRLRTAGTLDDLGEAGMVIATERNPEVQSAELARAGAEAPPGTLLALGAGADLAEMDRISGRPGDVLGLHMPPPAHRTRLLELAMPDGAAGDLVPSGIAFARRIGKVPVVLASGTAGQLTGALEGALFAAAEVLALTGTDPAAIDAAMRGVGLPLGPFEKADRGWLHPVDAPGGDSRLRARMQGAGWTGRAAGQGFYRYGTDGALQGVAPEARRLIGALREASRVPAAVTSPGEDEIRRRCLLAMANAGARLVMAGVVARPSDVDVAAIHGLGLARWLGGPMEAADQIGLLHARNLMRGWSGAGDLSMAVWTPAPLLDELIRSGGDFDSLNG